MENDENIKLYCFGSGSSGNCYYLKKGKSGIIIDIGISHRKLKKFFSDYGLAMADIRGILVSHSHTDHVRAVGAFSSAMRIPVYTTQQVHEGMERNFLMTKKILKDDKIIVNYHSKFQIGDTEIIAFPVPHDSNGNNGYLIQWAEGTLCFLTDVGAVTPEIINYVSQAEHLIVEANYDDTMLENGPYSEFLKKRIRSGSGHLCNTLTAQLITQYASPNIKNIWLCHLSQENNTPQVAVETITAKCQQSDRCELHNVPIVALKRTTPQSFDLK
jgi:phosphoribosyl 1,2-cyclic phosphodiesterase